jgi:hypothetical protein
MSRPRPKGRRRDQAVKPGRALTVHDATDFPCPFCGAQASVSERPAAVFHTMPPCSKYLALEAPDYLAAVNDAMGNQRPD